MARSYTKIYPTIWSDEEFIALTELAQRAYFLLATNVKLSNAGVMALQPSKWARLAADSTTTGLRDAIGKLIDERFVLVDDDTEELLVRSFIRHDGYFRDPNRRKAVLSAIDEIESPTLRAVAAEELARAIRTPSEGSPPDPDQDPRQDTPSDNSSLQSSVGSVQSSVSNFQRSAAAAADALAKLPPAAADAVLILANHRLHTEKDIRDPERYTTKIIVDTVADPIQFGRLCHEAERCTDPVEITVNVLCVSGPHARKAWKRLEMSKLQDPDPNCPDCAGEGKRRDHEDRFEDCPCRIASVTPLNRATA